jgi:UPF0716 family protein affecting phage T7 exclusion
MLVEPTSIIKSLSRGLGLGLIFLADGYVYVVLSRHLGIYLLLAIAAGLTLVETVAMYHNLRYEVECAQAVIRDGCYPKRNFQRLFVRVFVALLLIIPGFASDAVAILLLVPPFAWIAGSIAERGHRDELQQVYEQVRLQQ